MGTTRAGDERRGSVRSRPAGQEGPRPGRAQGLLRAGGLGLLASGLLLPGCMGAREFPEARHYRIAYAPPPVSANSPLPVTLGVAPLGGPETYRQERLVYRTLPHRVGFYPYDRWETPPVEMVTEALIGHLRAAGHFQQVVPLGREGRVDYVLRGRLLRFDQEDQGPGTPWAAVVEFDYQVVEAQRGEVVASGVARSSAPVQGRQPESIVEALSAATREALQALVPRVAAAVSPGAR